MFLFSAFSKIRKQKQIEKVDLSLSQAWTWFKREHWSFKSRLDR